MHKTYGYSMTGVLLYLINRILRIYPLYWISILLSILLIFGLSENITTKLNASIFLPDNISSLLRNLFIVFSIDTEPRLTPPAWALSVELFYYLIIGFGASRNLKISSIWFLSSLIYTAYLTLGGASFSYRYFTIAAASLPYSLGALTYFIPRNYPIKKLHMAIPITITLFTINYFIGIKNNNPTGIHFYLNTTLCGFLIIFLSRSNNKFKKIDSLLGDLSFPIYLLHYQCGIFVYFLFTRLQINPDISPIPFLVSSSGFCLILALLTALTLESRIERIHSRIRPKTVTL